MTWTNLNVRIDLGAPSRRGGGGGPGGVPPEVALDQRVPVHRHRLPVGRVEARQVAVRQAPVVPVPARRRVRAGRVGVRDVLVVHDDGHGLALLVGGALAVAAALGGRLARRRARLPPLLRRRGGRRRVLPLHGSGGEGGREVAHGDGGGRGGRRGGGGRSRAWAARRIDRRPEVDDFVQQASLKVVLA